jgi:hypothetical protein
MIALSRDKVARAKFLAISLFVLFSMISPFSFNLIAPVISGPGDPAKPMEFYLHYVDAPVGVAGLETKYIMDTTRQFQFSTKQGAYANSFYKPVGQPKIVVGFYLYPNLVGPVVVDGSWQVSLWVNSSAYRPVGFTLQFQEISVEGTTLWDSGLVTPKVTSSIGGYIDVPVFNYQLSAPLTHAFSAETTLFVQIEVNAGSSADTRIWYDSQFYPSKVVLPAKDYARSLEPKTYAYDNSETNLFHYNWSENHRVVIVRVNVTDPFGGYDINRVNMTIYDPAYNPVVDNLEMARKSDEPISTSFSHIYEANWSYPLTAQLGNYTVKVSVIDNNGYYHDIDTGFHTPFIEHATHIFTIGIIVYHNPTFRILDDVNDPLPKAQVYVTWLNGSRDVLPRYTSVNGSLTLTHLLSGNYGFTIIWKDVVVKQTEVYVNSDGPYKINAEVYQVTINVFDNNQVPIHGAYVIVYTQARSGIGLDTTNLDGQAVFKLPAGEYDIEAKYSAEYWLKVVTTDEIEENVSVVASLSKTLVLEEFPPPIWTTNGFWLIIILASIAILGVVLLLRKRGIIFKK